MSTKGSATLKKVQNQKPHIYNTKVKTQVFHQKLSLISLCLLILQSSFCWWNICKITKAQIKTLIFPNSPLPCQFKIVFKLKNKNAKLKITSFLIEILFQKKINRSTSSSTDNLLLQKTKHQKPIPGYPSNLLSFPIMLKSSNPWKPLILWWIYSNT